jgi:hypothetical protein
MSNERILNKYAYDTFKASIPYSALKQDIDTSMSVHIDWHELLASLSYDGKACIAESLSVGANYRIGHLSAILKCGKDEISIDVEVLNGENYDSLDRSILLLSRTMRTDIYYKYTKNMPGDVYFSTKGDNDKQAALFIYHNVIVQLNHTAEDGDVTKIAQLLVSKMKDRLVATSVLATATGIRSPTTYNVKVGDQFAIEIVPSNSQSIADVLISEVPPELKFINNENNVYEFRALEASTTRIPFTIYDPRTLTSSRHDILVVMVK